MSKRSKKCLNVLIFKNKLRNSFWIVLFNCFAASQQNECIQVPHKRPFVRKNEQKTREIFHVTSNKFWRHNRQFYWHCMEVWRANKLHAVAIERTIINVKSSDKDKVHVGTMMNCNFAFTSFSFQLSTLTFKMENKEVSWMSRTKKRVKKERLTSWISEKNLESENSRWKLIFSSLFISSWCSIFEIKKTWPRIVTWVSCQVTAVKKQSISF